MNLPDRSSSIGVHVRFMCSVHILKVSSYSTRRLVLWLVLQVILAKCSAGYNCFTLNAHCFCEFFSFLCAIKHIFQFNVLKSGHTHHRLKFKQCYETRHCLKEICHMLMILITWAKQKKEEKKKEANVLYVCFFVLAMWCLNATQNLYF